MIEDRYLALLSFLGVSMKVLSAVTLVATMRVGKSFSKASKALYAVENSSLCRSSNFIAANLEKSGVG